MKKPKADGLVRHKIVRLELGVLRPHPKNPNKHPESQKIGLGKSMRRYGVTTVPVVDEHNLILAGHARIETAIAEGEKHLDGIVVVGWSEKKKLEYMIADNRHGRLSEFDDDGLREILQSLQGGDTDFTAMGFDPAALAAALARPNKGLTDPDAAPPAREKPAVRLGDIWILGKHRIACGDSTKKETHEALCASHQYKLTATDPPYGVNYDPAWRIRAGVGSKEAAQGKVLNDDRANWEQVWSLLTGSVAYVWHGGLHGSVVQQSLEVAGFKLKAQIIWVKTRPALGRGNYHWQHEPNFYVAKLGKPDNFQFLEEHEVASYVVEDGSPHSWLGGRRQSTVWFIEHLKNDTGHGTQKPVECMRRPIINNSARGEYVFDPFLGSGTTLIACEMEGRHCLGIELDPTYVQVSIERWEAFTGEKAKLEATHMSLEQVAHARRSGNAKGKSNETAKPSPAPLRTARRRSGLRAARVAAAANS